MAYHSLAFVLLSQPTWEFHKAPKMPDAIWMAIMGAVGYKTLDGSLSKWVITAICLINGAQFFLAGFLAEMIARNNPDRKAYRVIANLGG